MIAMHIITPDQYRVMLARFTKEVAPSRRGFLKGIAAASGALVIGVHLRPVEAFAAAVDELVLRAITPTDDVDAYLRFIDVAAGVLDLRG